MLTRQQCGYISVLCQSSAALVKSPIHPERSLTFWVDDDTLYFYDNKGRLYASGLKVTIYKLGGMPISLTDLLQKIGFKERRWPMEDVVHNDTIIISAVLN